MTKNKTTRKVPYFNETVEYINPPEWWVPCINDKEIIKNPLKFGEHKAGFVPHGFSREPTILPPTWYEPCENGVKVGTKHVKNLNFGSDKLVKIARSENNKAKNLLSKPNPDKNRVQKHLSNAQDCILLVNL